MSKALTITLYKSELIYEIQNKTFLTGKSRETGSNFEQVANMQASDEDEHQNQILRSIGNAYDSLRAKLSSFLSGDEVTANNIQIDTNEISIVAVLTMPDNFNFGVSEAVKGALHRYIVNTSLFDWYVIAKPDEAKVYSDLSQNDLVELREALNKRIRPTRTAPVIVP